MPEVNLLAKLPKPKRNIGERKTAKTDWAVAIARLFGEQYFDGPREYGYGGYHYDGRWVPVAREIIQHYKLGIASRVLDVGCAKGFLVSDLFDAGVDAWGIDLSRYAVINCHPPVMGRLRINDALSLAFPDKSFDLVLSINTLHNFTRDGVIKALKEINRISRGDAFVQVDSYLTPEQKKLFEDWVLTARFHGYPEEWLAVFKEADYRGDYAWTIIQ